jgi:RimJ/RimL family protein N-acetyltransferase
MRWPLEVTVESAGVRLRAPDPIDAQAITDAVVANRDHLRRFLPWAETPTTVDQQAVRLATIREALEAGADAIYTLVEVGDRDGERERDGDGEDRVIGTVGLNRRQGPGIIEVGYWLVADAEGRGIMTEAVRRVVPLCFEDETVDVVQIRCHRDNVRSAGVPRRLGFTLVAEDGDDLVWELRR